LSHSSYINASLSYTTLAAVSLVRPDTTRETKMHISKLEVLNM